MRHFTAILLAGFLLAMAGTMARAGVDTLIMTNGETYVGEILKESPQTITFESELAGKLSLPHAAVKEIKRAKLPAPTQPRPELPRQDVATKRSTTNSATT